MIRSVRSRALLAMVVLACFTGCASAPARPAQTAPADAPAADRRGVLEGDLSPRTNLPPEAREILVARMARHGEVMTYLLASVVFLEYDDARSLALEIVNEPKLGRPAPGERDSLNALLPAPFFEYQDRLAIHAGELAAAAQAHQDDKLVASFGALAETCVACHAAYLNEESGQESWDASEGELGIPSE
jgi:hypothetical protein